MVRFVSILFFRVVHVTCVPKRSAERAPSPFDPWMYRLLFKVPYFLELWEIWSSSEISSCPIPLPSSVMVSVLFCVLRAILIVLAIAS